MKKILKWQVCLGLMILISILLMFQVLYNDLINMPQAEWSRYISLEDDNASDAYYNPYFDVFEISNHHYLAAYKDNQLDLSELQLDGQIESIARFDMTLQDVVGISTHVNADDSISVLINTDNTLYTLNIASDLNAITNPTLVVDNVSDAYLKSGMALFFQEDKLMLYDGQLVSQIAEDKHIETYSFDYDNGDFYIAVLNYADATYYSTLFHYNTQNQKTQSIALEKLRLFTGTVALETDIKIINDRLYTAYSLKNKRYGDNYHYLYEVTPSTLETLNAYTFTSRSYDPNVQIESFDGEPIFFINDNTFIGKTDVGTSSSTFLNVLKVNYDLSSSVPMTKSETYAPNLKLFTQGDYHYLITNEMTRGKNTLYMSSDEPNIIAASSKIEPSDIFNLFIIAISYIPASILPMTVPIISILFPVLLVIMILSIFKMSWVERNQGRMLIAGIVTYALVKIRFLWINASKYVFSESLYGNTPLHLGSFTSMMLTGLILMAASGLMLKLYMDKHPDSHFIARLIFFCLLDMVLFMMYFQNFVMLFL